MRCMPFGALLYGVSYRSSEREQRKGSLVLVVKYATEGSFGRLWSLWYHTACKDC